MPRSRMLEATDPVDEVADPPRYAGTVPEQFLYKISDVMCLLRMSRSVIYEQIKAGRLHTVKQGRATFVTASAIGEYIALLERESRSGR